MEFECEIKEIIIYPKTQLPMEFYMELYKEYPTTWKYWEIVTDEEIARNIVQKDGKFYDSVSDLYKSVNISDGGYTILYNEYRTSCIKIKHAHEWKEYTIYFVKGFPLDNLKVFTPHENERIYLDDPKCIEIMKRLGYTCIYSVPKCLDILTYNNCTNRFKGKIDKREIINELMEIEYREKNSWFYFLNPLNPRVYKNYNTQLLFENAKLKIEDIEKYLKKWLKNFWQEEYP
jgi:hypothetical protein